MPSFDVFLFWAFAAITALCAVAVVVSQNIVRSATWLLFTLGGASAIFFLLGADFVGATQLLVYVGGTLVLVVFGVMLTAQGPFITMKTGPAEWVVSAVVGLIFLAVIVVSILQTTWPAPPEVPRMNDAASSMSTTNLGLALLGFPQATQQVSSKPEDLRAGQMPVELTGFDRTKAPLSRRVRTRVAYLLPFEIVSVHLLVVLLGAAYLARAKRRRGAVP
jgi:NADH:ubiquinone oxidoreductase subunit 6 (subunit J)